MNEGRIKTRSIRLRRTPTIQHHVLMEIAGSNVLLASYDEDCLEQAHDLAFSKAIANGTNTAVTTTVAEYAAVNLCKICGEPATVELPEDGGWGDDAGSYCEEHGND